MEVWVWCRLKFDPGVQPTLLLFERRGYWPSVGGVGSSGASIDSKIVALKKQMKGVQKEFRSLPEGKARDVLKQ